MARLRTQLEWGDITEAEYRSKMDETRAQSAGLPVAIVPAARPFFAGDDALLMAPPDGLEPPTQALGRPRSIH